MFKLIIVQTGFDKITNQPTYQLANHMEWANKFGVEIYKTEIMMNNPPRTLDACVDDLKSYHAKIQSPVE